jgi:hypothetical protein
VEISDGNPDRGGINWTKPGEWRTKTWKNGRGDREKLGKGDGKPRKPLKNVEK